MILGWMHIKVAHFLSHDAHFCRMSFFLTLIMNNKLIKLRIWIWYILTTWSQKKLCNYFSTKVNPLFTMDFWNTKIWIGQYNRMVENKKVHIEVHSKLFIGTQYMV
jgi:hypothetical protein